MKTEFHSGWDRCEEIHSSDKQWNAVLKLPAPPSSIKFSKLDSRSTPKVEHETQKPLFKAESRIDITAHQQNDHTVLNGTVKTPYGNWRTPPGGMSQIDFGISSPPLTRLVASREGVATGGKVSIKLTDCISSNDSLSRRVQGRLGTTGGFLIKEEHTPFSGRKVASRPGAGTGGKASVNLAYCEVQQLSNTV